MNLKKKIKTFNLNFGPQHPSAHGVLRLILELWVVVLYVIGFLIAGWNTFDSFYKGQIELISEYKSIHTYIHWILLLLFVVWGTYIILATLNIYKGGQLKKKLKIFLVGSRIFLFSVLPLKIEMLHNFIMNGDFYIIKKGFCIFLSKDIDTFDLFVKHMDIEKYELCSSLGLNVSEFYNPNNTYLEDLNFLQDSLEKVCRATPARPWDKIIAMLVEHPIICFIASGTIGFSIGCLVMYLARTSAGIDIKAPENPESLREVSQELLRQTGEFNSAISRSITSVIRLRDSHDLPLLEFELERVRNQHISDLIELAEFLAYYVDNPEDRASGDAESLGRDSSGRNN